MSAVTVWVLVAMVCGALAGGTVALPAMVAWRLLADQQARTRAGRSALAMISRLFDRLAVIVAPLTTWGYRRRADRLLRRAGVAGWSSGHLFALQLICSLAGIAAVLACCRTIGVPFARNGGIGSLFESCLIAGGAATGCLLPRVWLRQQRLARIQEIGRGMPSFLDLLCLGLDCGMNLQASVQLALEHLPPGALRAEWHQMLLDMRSGAGRAEALRQLSDRVDVPAIRQLVATLAQGERAGLGMTRILGEFARHERARRMMAAEKQAMRAPVKMLIPMALCIFPCTFLILGFPVLVTLADMTP